MGTIVPVVRQSAFSPALSCPLSGPTMAARQGGRPQTKKQQAGRLLPGCRWPAGRYRWKSLCSNCQRYGEKRFTGIHAGSTLLSAIAAAMMAATQQIPILADRVFAVPPLPLVGGEKLELKKAGASSNDPLLIRANPVAPDMLPCSSHVASRNRNQPKLSLFRPISIS